jgi:chromosome segregation ATPase
MPNTQPVITPSRVGKGATVEFVEREDKKTGQLYLSLEEATFHAIDKSDKLRTELRQNSEMLQDGLKNNPTYREYEEKLKEARKALLQVKSQIMKQPSMALLDQKCKDLRFDMKELQTSISEYLLQMVEISGETTMEKNGILLTVKQTATLVRGSQTKK